MAYRRYDALALSFFLLTLVPAYSQDARFARISREDGLSSSSVSSIVQDSRGFLWFGTKNGLDRYDGYSFTVYSNDPFDSGSLSHDLVQTLWMDADDILWVGTYGGLDRFDTHSRRIVRFPHDPADPSSLSSDIVTAIHRDRSGRLWVGTLDGLNVLDEASGSFRRYRDAADGGALANDAIRSILETKEGSLWVGTYGGLFSYDRDSDSFSAFPGLPSNSVMALSEDESGALWAGCWGGGLVRISADRKESRVWSFPDNRIYTLLTGFPGVVYAGTWGGGLVELDTASDSYAVHRADPRRPFSLTSDVIYSLRRDDAGLLWVGTNGGGLYKLDRGRDRFELFSHDPDNRGGLSKGTVLSVFEDSRKRLWVGTYSGGLDRLDPGSADFRHYRFEPGNARSLSNDIVNAVMEDGDGRIWVATNEGLNRFDESTGGFDRFSGPDPTFYSLAIDSEGRRWHGFFRGGAERVDPKTGERLRFSRDPNDPGSLSDNLVYFIRPDSRGSVWFGTNRGLDRWDGEGRALIHYRHDGADRKSLPGDTVRCLLEDSRGRLWVGTSPGGLSLLDPETGTFSHIAKSEGLSASGVVSILEDEAGRLWLGTDSGLRVYDPATRDLKTLDARDGLQGAEFSSACFRNAEGELYFGGVEGLNRISHAALRRNAHVPPVRLTSFKVFDRDLFGDREVADAREVRLSHRENFISIEFAALDYADPAANRYAYKLEGFDHDWTSSGARRYASYTNLPGGSYVFRVRASNDNGVWNDEGLRLPIFVTPSFWTTPAAFVLYAAAAVFIVLIFLAWLSHEQRFRLSVAELAERKRIGAELKAAKERAEAADKAKSEFLANLSHEIRTPMNAVLGYAGILSEKMADDPRRSLVEVIDRSGRSLLALINDALDLSRLDAGKAAPRSAPLRPRVLLSDMAEMFRLRVEEKGLALDVSVDPSVPSVIVGDESKLRQILVNLIGNAIKFTDRGSIRVDLRVEGDPLSLALVVSDTGIGLSPEAKPRVFEPFFQQEQVSERFGGTGLGLTIVHRLVDELGGSIRVESEPGFGSRFTVCLPQVQVPEGAEPPPLQAGAARDDRRIDGLDLLIVEDDPVGADLLGRMLSGRGAAVRFAVDGEAGLREIEIKRPDAVLADLRMPRLDGFSFLDALRRHPPTRNLPVLIVSADLRAETRSRLAVYGAALIVPKPVDPSFLLDCLESALPGRSVGLPPAGETARDGGLSRESLSAELGEAKAESAVAELSGAALEARRAISAALIVDEWTAFVGEVEAVFARFASRVLGRWASRARSALTSFDADELARLRAEFDELMRDRPKA